jgi:2,4-diketo-3-deoxy-L-fuconate hydrolase
MSYALAALTSGRGIVPAIKIGEDHYPLEKLTPGLIRSPGRGLMDLLERWETADAAVSQAIADERHRTLVPLRKPINSEFAAPILYPPKVLCTGVNYYDHLRQDVKAPDFDKSKHNMLHFIKHQRSIVGPSSGVRYPSQSKQLDWEVELVVVFGRTGRRIPAARALDYVAGYSVGIDLAVRDWQFNPRHFKQFDLMAGKSFDDSCPLGPYVVPARFVTPKDVALRLWVNDELKQDSTTREMIWSIEEQIAALSQHVTIEAGDVLYTGSPAGIGYVSNTFLKVGDQVRAEIAGLGTLEVQIIPDPDASSVVGL